MLWHPSPRGRSQVYGCLDQLIHFLEESNLLPFSSYPYLATLYRADQPVTRRYLATPA